jgi:dephospho-CoA kinase
VIAQQARRPLRRACADAVIFNDGIAPERLAGLVQALWERWIRPAC